MYRQLILIGGFMLGTSSGLCWAATIGSANEQAVTRTITTDLGTSEPTMTVNSGSSSNHILNVVTNADGTRRIPLQNIGDNISFSATGADQCKITVTSPYTNAANLFIMVKDASDITESIRYLFSFKISNIGTIGNSTYVIDQVSFPISHLPQYAATSSSDFFISIKSNTSGVCGLALEDTQIQSNNVFPASWRGTRTGIINITMTVDGAATTPPITQ